ncbi:MAG: hypothetical protein COB90_04995 [Hyphomicrobiales bacterium]|nr:MAG: hypothetical protein COB90_04995 [Hyphomicrobiales bacterium]
MSLAKLNRLIGDPAWSASWIATRCYPKIYLGYLRRQSTRLKLNQPRFMLSFDCDTPADIDASARLSDYFKSFGILPVIAAPADIIEMDIGLFRALVTNGQEFLNHGSKHHAAIDKDGEIISTLSYGSLSTSEWQKDIVDADRRLRDYLHIDIKGFRTPHFGEFESRRNLIRLYKLLIKLGYSWSSSTSPLHVPLTARAERWTKGQLTEFPVTGHVDRPSQIIDSWSYSMPNAPQKTMVESIIFSLKTYRVLMSKGDNLFINVYFDPHQLEQQPCICEELAQYGRWAIARFDELYQNTTIRSSETN